MRRMSSAPIYLYKHSMILRTQILGLALLLFFAPYSVGMAPSPYIVKLGVMVPMRDGVRLATDLYLPNSTGKFPVLLARTPYGRNMFGVINLIAKTVTVRGYALAVQDVRGRFGSEGTFYPFKMEGPDGYDTVEWLAHQPWCNGKVGMFGPSYLGVDQLQAAVEDPPNLIAIAPGVAPSGFVETTGEGGALAQSLIQGWLAEVGLQSKTLQKRGTAVMARYAAQLLKLKDWYRHLPIIDFTPLKLAGEGYEQSWQDIFKHYNDPAYFDKMGVVGRYNRIRTPALMYTGWYDALLNGVLQNYEGMAKVAARTHRFLPHLVIGPWVHGGTEGGKVVSGKFTFDIPKDMGYMEQALDWFDYWLKGKQNGVNDEPPVELYVMGADRFIPAKHWPPKRIRLWKLYLTQGRAGETHHWVNPHNAGDLVDSPPSNSQAPSRWIYNPAHPTPTMGGNNLTIASGAMDQRPVEKRNDVWTFTTQPLRKKVEIVGPISADLYVSTSAADTDFTAKLVEVMPDGTAWNLADGIIRLRYRDSRTHPTFVKPNTVVPVTIRMGATGVLLAPGDRIRLEISSSNFPRFDRNLNTKASIGYGVKMVIAHNGVYHNRKYHSHLNLPLMPIGDLSP